VESTAVKTKRSPNKTYTCYFCKVKKGSKKGGIFFRNGIKKKFACGRCSALRGLSTAPCKTCGCQNDIHPSATCSYCKTGSHVIQGYHHTEGVSFYTPNGIIYEDAVDNKIPFFGIELECLVKNIFPKGAGAEIAYRLTYPWAEIKFDRTVDKWGGFEITSQPMTFETHYSSDKWNLIFDFYEKHPIYVFENERCGTHIHISRGAFELSELVQIARFFGEEQKFVETIGERAASDQNIYPSQPADVPADSYPAYLEIYLGMDHHNAVNTFAKKTVEFRIFQANMRREGFFKNLEFVHLLWHMVKNKIELSQSNVIMEVQKQSTKYRNLFMFLRHLGNSIGRGRKSKSFLTSGHNYILTQESVEKLYKFVKSID
jgi:hypothetical protein